MGTDVSAFALIGIKILREKLEVKNRVKNCEHSVPEHAQFCPTCGKRAFRTEKSYIPAVVENEDYQSFLGDFRIIGINDGDPEKKHLFLGFSVETGSHRSFEVEAFGKLPDLVTLRARLLEVTKKYDLMSEEMFDKKFGLYALTDVSC